MSLIVRYRDRLLAVASPSDSPDQWLITMRWCAILGMLVTTWVGKLLVPPLRIAPLLTALEGLVVVNLIWIAVLWRWPVRGITLLAQLSADVLLLGIILGYSGGLSNPFAPFLTFQIVLAGLLASWRTTALITALSLVVAAALSTAAPLPIEAAVWDPERVRVLARLFAVVSLGLFLGFFVILYARRLERVYEEAARNEKLAALGRTVAAMCHELNTPLGTILIAGKDLEQLGGASGSSEIQELARSVSASARRASDIISLLHGAVRPNARTERLELASYVTRYANDELDRLGYTGARRFFTEEPVELHVLPTALGQILTNLLGNAVDALRGMPDPRIDIALVPHADHVELAISDNGKGVSPQVLAHLGEPFQTTKEQGTGLGLYVSSLLAERMGGFLELETLPRGGARLTLRLGRKTEATA